MNLDPSSFSPEDLQRLAEKTQEYHDNPAKLHQDINGFFEQFDEDKNGSFDKKELRHFMESFFKQWELHLPLRDDDVLSLFLSIDTNHDGKIQPNELETFSTKFVDVLYSFTHQQ